MDPILDICPCQSGLEYGLCCEPYLTFQKNPPTPEATMRSRYTAYSLGNIPYIKQSMCGKPLEGFDEEEALVWSRSVTWLGLTIVSAKKEKNDRGLVEFKAKYKAQGKTETLHEISQFKKINHKWFYVDGTYPKRSNRAKPKQLPRNQPCPCGSGRKFKNCCSP